MEHRLHPQVRRWLRGCTLRLEHIRRAPLQRGCAVRRLPLSSPHARGTHDCCAARQGADFPSAAQRRAARARGHDAVGFFRQSRPRPAPGALLGRRHMRSSCAREPAHARLPVLPCACDMPQTRAKQTYVPALCAQGQRAPGLLFVVTGTLQVGRQTVGPGGYACLESILQLVQHFGGGLPDCAQAVVSQDVVCLQASTCLLLSLSDLSQNMPMMRTLAQAAVAAEDSDEDASPQPASEQTLPRGLSAEDLKAHRNELMRKLEAAQLQAKKEELEKQVRSMAAAASRREMRIEVPRRASPGRTSGRPGSPRALPRAGSGSGSPQVLPRPASGSPGSFFELQSPVGAVAALKRTDVMARSHSDTDVARNAASGAVREQGLHVDTPVASTAVQNLPLQVMRQAVHPTLRGVIPLPRPREPDRDVSRRYDPEYLQQLARHRTMWGAVWETSHYFNHQVYRRNVPKTGIPVDTTGDGRADSLAVDITGNGRVDLILSDSLSQQVALKREGIMKRSHSLDELIQ